MLLSAEVRTRLEPDHFNRYDSVVLAENSTNITNSGDDDGEEKGEPRARAVDVVLRTTIKARALMRSGDIELVVE